MPACRTSKNPWKWLLFVILIVLSLLGINYSVEISRHLANRSQLYAHRNSFGAFKESNPSGKTVLFWTTFFGVEDFYVGLETAPFRLCSSKQCFTTSDRSLLNQSDAIIFHIRDLDMKDLPDHRFAHQYWIFYLLESPSNTPRFFNTLDNMFNWTFTYRRDSDLFSPYSVNVNLYEEKDLASLRAQLANKKKKVAWFVSNCNTPSKRELYAEELSNYINVDFYGACGTLQCLDRVPCYQMLGRDYKFYLAFENSLCLDYVTEKFFNVLKYGVVPVVYGSANYSSFISKDAFINVQDFESPKHLADYLNFLDANMTAYERYFDWRFEDQIEDYRPFCDLCEMLHNVSLPAKSYSNMRNWWFQKSQCVAVKDLKSQFRKPV